MPRLSSTERKNRERGEKNPTNGSGKVAFRQQTKSKVIEIPRLEQGEMTLTIIGDRPLMVNNKLAVAQRISDQYSGKGKAGAIKAAHLSDDENYVRAFYVMPSSKLKAPSPKAKYGVPTSGIKKCADKAIRTTGITDNTTIGTIGRAFQVMEDEAGLCEISFGKLVRDVRAVNIGSGQKTVPQMRHRPMFHDWKIKLRIKYNRKVISEEQIVNLCMHAGQYIGLCEMRAEKKQGQCGGFIVK